MEVAFTDPDGTFVAWLPCVDDARRRRPRYSRYGHRLARRRGTRALPTPPDQAAGAPDPSFGAAGDGRAVIPGAGAGDATACGAGRRGGRLHARRRGELRGSSSPTARPTRASLPAASRTSARLRTSASAALVLPSPHSRRARRQRREQPLRRPLPAAPFARPNPMESAGRAVPGRSLGPGEPRSWCSPSARPASPPSHERDRRPVERGGDPPRADCSDSDVAPAEALVGPQDPNFEIFGTGIDEPRCGTGLVTAGGSRSAGSC